MPRVIARIDPPHVCKLQGIAHYHLVLRVVYRIHVEDELELPGLLLRVDLPEVVDARAGLIVARLHVAGVDGLYLHLELLSPTLCGREIERGRIEPEFVGFQTLHLPRLAYGTIYPNDVGNLLHHILGVVRDVEPELLGLHAALGLRRIDLRDLYILAVVQLAEHVVEDEERIPIPVGLEPHDKRDLLTRVGREVVEQRPPQLARAYQLIAHGAFYHLRRLPQFACQHLEFWRFVTSGLRYLRLVDLYQRGEEYWGVGGEIR